MQIVIDTSDWQRLSAPLMGSPSIVDGIWFQGDCAGVLHAFDVRNARVEVDDDGEEAERQRSYDEAECTGVRPRAAGRAFPVEPACVPRDRAGAHLARAPRVVGGLPRRRRRL